MQGKMIFREMSHVCSFEGANLYSSLAQSVEHAAVNRSVVGSSPTGGVFGNMKSDIKQNFLPGSMVKRLRHRPFTAVTGVQIPLESLCKISYMNKS